MVRKIRAKLVLQLRVEGLSGRAISASQGMSRKSVRAVFEAADMAGIGWDDVAELPDECGCMRDCFRAVGSMRACLRSRTGNRFIASSQGSASR